jgi:hypothetical protein
MTKAEMDWEGREVAADEDPNEPITAWRFRPGRSGDECIVRDYHRAIKYAKDLIRSKMDDFDENDMRHGVPIRIEIDLVRITPSKLAELISEGEL